MVERLLRVVQFALCFFHFPVGFVRAFVDAIFNIFFHVTRFIAYLISAFSDFPACFISSGIRRSASLVSGIFHILFSVLRHCCKSKYSQ